MFFSPSRSRPPRFAAAAHLPALERGSRARFSIKATCSLCRTKAETMELFGSLFLVCNESLSFFIVFSLLFSAAAASLPLHRLAYDSVNHLAVTRSPLRRFLSEMAHDLSPDRQHQLPERPGEFPHTFAEELLRRGHNRFRSEIIRIKRMTKRKGVKDCGRNERKIKKRRPEEGRSLLNGRGGER